LQHRTVGEVDRLQSAQAAEAIHRLQGGAGTQIERSWLEFAQRSLDGK